MKTSLLVIICSLFALHSHSQITMGGVKGKVADKAKSTVKSAASEPEEKPKTQYAIDQENMKNSPAYQSIYDFRFHAPIALDEIKHGRYMKVDSAFLAGKLNEIRRLDPTWIDLEKDQATFDTIVKKCTPYWTEQYYNTRLTRIRSVSQNLLDYSSSTKYTDLKEDDDIGKVRYEALRSGYLKIENPTSLSLKYIRDIDTFYTIFPQRIKASIMEKNVEKMRVMGSNTKDIRSQPDFIDKIAGYQIPYIDPASVIKLMNEYQADLRKALILLPDDKELTEIINKLDPIKVDYAEYISSGEYEKNIPIIRHKRLDAVRCPKAVNTNPTLTAVVKKAFETTSEKFLRASITSSDWKINKNVYGNIDNRTMEVYVVYTTADGKCFFQPGELYCDYVGGKWSNAKFHFNGRDAHEMLAENAQK